MIDEIGGIDAGKVSEDGSIYLNGTAFDFHFGKSLDLRSVYKSPAESPVTSSLSGQTGARKCPRIG